MSVGFESATVLAIVVPVVPTVIEALFTVFVFDITVPNIVLLPTINRPLIFVVPAIDALPVTFNEPVTVVFTFTSKPLFGEITACAEPDLILSISPNAVA